MTNTELLAEMAASVQALFIQQRGAFHPTDFIAVAGLLGFEARPAATPLAGPQPIASNHFLDLVGTNLQHALATYAWGDWRPLSDDGGVQRAEGREQRAESREQRAESRSQRGR